MSSGRELLTRLVSAWSDFRERARSLLFRASEERDMREELVFHLEQEIEKNLREGMPPAEARRRALVAFGGVDRFTEQVREARGTLWIENVARDARLAARGLRRNPGFTAVAVLTLAIGIGGTTTVFALANWLLLRPVPGVADPDELIVARLESAPGSGLITATLSPLHIADVRAGTPALSGLTAQLVYGGLQARIQDGAPFQAEAIFVEGDYFGTLGLRPLLGRWFTEEERSDASVGDVIVVSERFWSSRLGRSPDAIGATVQMNGEIYRVVGVAPVGFHGTDRTGEVDVWLPVAAYGRLRHRDVDAAELRLFYELVGRLAPGAGVAQAQQQLDAATEALARSDPELAAQLDGIPPFVYPAIGVPVALRDGTARTLRLLMGAVGLLLLIACANVANLLLFRGLGRRSEVAVRRALGASNGRLLQRQLMEATILAILGGVLGIALSVGVAAAVEGQGLPGLPPLDDLPLDWRVSAFALGVALASGLLATLLPALLALRPNALAAVRSGDGSATARGVLTRGGLTVLQVAASLTLLIGALLLVRTVRNLGGVELGLDADAVLAFGYTPAPQGYDDAATMEMRRRLLDELGALPEIESAGMVSFLPVGSRNGRLASLSVPGGEAQAVRAFRLDVSAAYFPTIGTRLLDGRGFTPAEQYESVVGARGVVLSLAAARALFGDARAVGRTIEVRAGGDPLEKTVLGVADDVRSWGPRREAEPTLYLPLGAATLPATYVLVRSSLPPELIEPRVREAIAGLDPAIPLFHAGALSEAAGRYLAEERLLARLLGLFAVLATTLAAIGIYGVVAYSVAHRRREIGIRIALGASGGAVAGLVAGQALRLVLVGVGLGAVGGYGLSRVLASRLFGVTAVDPFTYLAGAGLFASIALAASALPARVAAAVDPITTLKAE